MVEVLERLLKEYRKNAQKIKVRAIGRSGANSKEIKKRIITRLGTIESRNAQKSISKATKGLEETVKGQFGTKVTEVFEKQKQTLDNF